MTRHAVARLALAAALAVPLVPTFATGRAAAWANAGDGYSTHDYVVDLAVEVLAGRAPWFDAAAARLVTDDPDKVQMYGSASHLYRDQGRRGGAVTAVTELYGEALDHYEAAKSALAKGDQVTARARFHDTSVKIGLLSHYFSDILMPWHSSQAGVGAANHGEYEILVHHQTRSASARPDWHSSRRTVSPISNIRQVVIDAAAFSRPYFEALYADMLTSPTALTLRSQQITGGLMRRAANDLANIIYSVSLGVGDAPQPATFTARMKYQFVDANYPTQAVYVTAKDAVGRPIEGLEVDFKWTMPDGSIRIARECTNELGVARHPGSSGSGPRSVRRTVWASAVTSGVVKSTSTWFIVTPAMAAGSAGFRTVVNDSTLRAGQTVTVTSIARDSAGRGIKGLRVVWTWNYGHRIITTSGYTNDLGRASSSRLIRTTTTYGLVSVTARTVAARIARSSSTSFQRV